MNEIEVFGATKEEALQLALEQLHAKVEDVEYEVLEEASKGFFGFGKKECKLIVRKKDTKTSTASSKEPAAVTPDPAPAPVETQEIRTQEAVAEEHIITTATTATIDATDSETDSEDAEGEEIDRSNFEVKEELDPEQRIRDFLSEILATQSMNAQIEIDNRTDAYYVRLVGEEAGALIGHRGEGLDALQLLVSMVANKEKRSYKRVFLDIENYREKRRSSLENYAMKKARLSAKQRRNIKLDNMNSYERRIVHALLQNDKFVTTHSEGEEPHRHVVIEYVGKAKPQADYTERKPHTERKSAPKTTAQESKEPQEIHQIPEDYVHISEQEEKKKFESFDDYLNNQ